VIIDREFSRRRLDRGPCRQQTLDPHAFEVITALTPPRSRTLFSRHLCPQDYASNNPTPLSRVEKQALNIVQKCGAVMASELDKLTAA
jgi:hypothetical protein